MSNKDRRKNEPDTSKISSVLPPIFINLDGASTNDSKPNPEQDDSAMKNADLIKTVFGSGSFANMVDIANVNTFQETARYRNFRRFYQQQPSALLAVLEKMFRAWKISPFAIEADILEQDNQYVKDAKLFRGMERRSPDAHLLTQVAYTLFARNESELVPLLTDAPDDGRDLFALVVDLVETDETQVLGNSEFASFWHDVSVV